MGAHGIAWARMGARGCALPPGSPRIDVAPLTLPVTYQAPGKV